MSKLLIECLFLIVWFKHFNSEVYSDRPKIRTDDGNLIIESAYDKNIYLRINGPKSSVYLGTINLLNINTTTNGGQLQPASGDDFEKYINGPNGILRRLEILEQTVPRDHNTVSSDLSFNVSRLWRKYQTLRTLLTNLEKSIDRKFNNDECRSSPCEHGGTCLNLLNGVHCLCPSNWEGKYCDVDVNECRNFAGTDLGCQNGATCINRQGSYECFCRPGWFGLHCTRKLKDCSGGDYEMCGHGSCVLAPNAPEGIKCLCDQGWTTNSTGVACLTDINECESSQGPRCSVNPKVKCINLPGSFRCGQCPPGYEGDGYICSDINECLLVPNGGCSTSPMVTCHNTIGSRICGPCPSGFQGDGITCSWRGSCSINGGGCHPSAQCIDNSAFGGQLTQCVCPDGMSGDGIGLRGCYVQTNGNITQGCVTDPCGVHGQCHNLPTGYTCICFRGYGGAHCDSPINNCAVNPCRNGGSCISDDNTEKGFRCECTAQYSGTLCQIISKTCGGVLDAEEGSIVYPLSNSTYNHNARCAWIIHTDPDKVINVTFSKFNLEENSECIYDFLQIHDGRSSASQLIGRFCGKSFPKAGNIVSSFNNLYFWFRSDQTIAKDGFALHWTSIKPVCGGEVNASIHGHISSPGSPGNYPPNRDCYWHLTTSYGKRVQLFFFEFDIESHSNCSFDYLAIYDGEHITDPLVNKYCNSTQPGPVQSAGSEVLVHFHSDAYGSGKGFQIAFAPIDGVPGCGGYYTQDRGEISSPSFNGKYLNNLICEYKIKTSPDTQIRINFVTFKLERAFRCRYDYLKVYDGSSTDSPLVGRFCGSTYPKYYISSSNILFIIFKSDITTSYEGFKITYETVCRKTLVGDSGIIKSPGYPFNYPENRVCEYTIVTLPGKAILLTFQVFDVEDNVYFNCQYDNVEIRDGININSTLLGRYCGSERIPPPVTSTHNYMYIRFKSDISVSGTGFYANYTTIDIKCGGIYRDNKGTINHPKTGTDVYEDEESCTWILIAPEGMNIKLTWNRFRLENMPSCHSDYLELIEIDENNKNDTLGKFCGDDMPPALTTSSNRLMMKFKSDSSVQLEGFSVSYTFLDEKTHCGGVFIKSHGYIYSPGWPKRYEPNRDCSWTIRVPFGQQIKLNITEFDLERPIRDKCDHGDYLEVRNGAMQSSPLIGTYCGTFRQKIIVSTTNVIYLRFHSDFYLTGRGFKIEWDGSLTGCGGTLTSSSGSISSPNYPQKYYDNAECFYRIVTSFGSRIHISFEELQLERTANCRDDYVEIYDGRDTMANSLGKLCHLSPKSNSIETSSNYAYIKFRSDFFIGGKGFLLQYETVCQNNVTGSYGIIESPDYPNTYKRMLNCLWTINVSKGNKINVTFTHFDIFSSSYTYRPWMRTNSTSNLSRYTLTTSCEQDFLQIKELSDLNFGTKICGTVLPRPFTTKSNSLQIKFVTNSFANIRNGFRLEWVRHGCGGQIQKRYGSIAVDSSLTSVGVMECEWLIESPIGTKITLSINNLNMVESKNCTTDAIEIYNGQNIASPLITKICHKGRTSMTTTNVMLVRFVKNSSLKDVHFTASFDSYSTGNCGSRIVSPSGLIFSPNYPKKNYDNNMDCLWTITVPRNHRIELNFMDLDLYSDDSDSSCSDFINIYDTIYYTVRANYTQRICPASNVSQIFSKYNTLTLQFITNGFGTAKGFAANFTVTCGAVLEANYDGIISNAKYSSHSNRSCIWTILAPNPVQKITLTITHMSIPKSNEIITNRNCPSSFLRVFDGDDDSAPLIDEYCGRKIPPTIVSRGSALTVQLGTYSDKITGQFSAHYSSLTTACGGSLTSEEGTIASPNYPDSYPVGANCEWTLNTSPGNKVYITFEKFDLEYSEFCNDDYLEVRENNGIGKLLGVYCGNNIPTNTTAASKLYIKFHSNNKNTGQGFMIHYGFLHGNEITDSSSGEIASPLFPFPYDGSGEFTWRIFAYGGSVISVTIDRLEIPVHGSACYNGLIIYDGYNDEAAKLEELCGKLSDNKIIIQTSANVAYIKFKLDDTNVGSLFHIRWTEADNVVEDSMKTNCGSNETKLILPGQSIVIESPNYPNDYIENLKCAWVFKSTPGRHLSLLFQNFHLEDTSSCFADYISVFSSNTGVEWTPVRERICTMENLNDVFNSSTYMNITFETDSSVNRKGFRANVSSVCGGELTSLSGEIEPTWFDWQNVYRTSFRSNWKVKVRPGRVIKLNFEHFNITNRGEDCNVFVTLYNGDSTEAPFLGNGKYCGYSHENHDQLRTSGNLLFVSYINTMRSLGEFQNFRIRYEEEGTKCGLVSELSADHDWEIINTPNYPSIPDAYSECIWKFAGPPGEILRIDFIDRFVLKSDYECSSEYVEIRDGASDMAPLKGRYCNRNPGSIKTSSNQIYIKYVTQYSVPNDGFKANVSIDVCGGTLVANTGEISSPGYPHFFGIRSGSVCEWRIIGTPGLGLKIKAQDIDLPESDSPCATKVRIEETMKINNTVSILKTFCESDTQDDDTLIETFSNEVVIKLFVGNPGWGSLTESRGFRFTFNSSRLVCGGSITTSEGFLTTPGYPRETSLRYCQWLITAPDKTRRIRVELLDAELEIDKHRIGIYNDLNFQSAILTTTNKNKPLTTQVFESSGSKVAVYVWLLPYASEHRFKAKFSTNDEALCGGSLTGDSGVLESPDLSRSYTCEWHYNSISNTPTPNLIFNTIYVTAVVNSSVEKTRCQFTDPQLQIKSIEDSNYNFNQRLCGKKEVSLRIPSPGIDIKAIQSADNFLQFHLEWKLQPCGGEVHIGENEVNIFNALPISYNDSLNCMWIIKVQFGSTVELKLEGSFQLGCDDEYVKIRFQLSSPPVADYCKDRPQDSPIVIPNANKYIEYHSSVKSNTTIKLMAKAISNQCGGYLNTYETTFMSPNYPREYAANQECVWEINSELGMRISLSFVDRFVIENKPNCTKDAVIIYDWRDDAYIEIAKICGRELPPVYNSTYNKMKVVLRTDADTNLDGFKARWTTICGGKYTATEKEQILYSPGYPNAYMPFLNCFYEISAPGNRIIAKFLDFDLEGTPPSCDFDNVTIDAYDNYEYDFMIYCGNDLPPIFSNSDKLKITFKTDSYLQRKGFKLSYSIYSCGGQIKEPTILTSGPLEHYDNNLNCTWTIEAPVNRVVVLKLLYIDLENSYECQNDYLGVYNGQLIRENKRLAILCGRINTTTVFRSKGNSLVLQFVTDSSAHYKGFKAEIVFTYSEAVGCGGHTDLTSTSNYILKSPLMASKVVYENYLDCQWTITAPADYFIKLEFTSFHIASCRDVNQTAVGYSKCDCDFVEVKDGINPHDLVMGTYCGHTLPPQLHSSGNLMNVRLSTDGDIPSLGFEARVSVQESMCGKTVYKVTRNTQTLKSPGYGSLTRGIHCAYRLLSSEQSTPIRISVKNVDLQAEEVGTNECKKDKLLIISSEIDLNATLGSDFILNRYSDTFFLHSQFYEENLRFPDKFVFCGVKKSVEIYVYGNVAINLLTSPESDSLVHKGFELDIVYAGFCGRNYTEPQGRIQSFFENENIDDVKDCFTLITAPENHTIALYFITVYPDYWNDDVHIKIFDGETTKAPLLAKIVSEYDNNIPIFSTGRYILLHNHAETQNQVTFDLNYVTTDRGRGCGGKLHNELGRITSPLYPNIFRQKATCEWELETPIGTRLLLHFQIFDLGKSCDQNAVTLVDRNGATLSSYCSEFPADYTSVDNYVKVIFTTTLNNGGTGWIADFIGIL